MWSSSVGTLGCGFQVLHIAELPFFKATMTQAPKWTAKMSFIVQLGTPVGTALDIANLALSGQFLE